MASEAGSLASMAPMPKRAVATSVRSREGSISSGRRFRPRGTGRFGSGSSASGSGARPWARGGVTSPSRSLPSFWATTS